MAENIYSLALERPPPGHETGFDFLSLSRQCTTVIFHSPRDILVVPGVEPHRPGISLQEGERGVASDDQVGIKRPLEQNPKQNIYEKCHIFAALFFQPYLQRISIRTLSPMIRFDLRNKICERQSVPAFKNALQSALSV